MDVETASKEEEEEKEVKKNLSITFVSKAFMMM